MRRKGFNETLKSAGLEQHEITELRTMAYFLDLDVILIWDYRNPEELREIFVKALNDLRIHKEMTVIPQLSDDASFEDIRNMMSNWLEFIEELDEKNEEMEERERFWDNAEKRRKGWYYEY